MGSRSIVNFNGKMLQREQNAAARPYDLSHPVIRPVCRRVFERVHRNIAERWSSMIDDASAAVAKIRFAGLTMQTVAEAAGRIPDASHVASFVFSRNNNAGFLVFYPGFVSALVQARMGESDANNDGVRQFTRLESVVARDLEKDFVARLGEVYRSSAIGGIGAVAPGATIADNFLFSPSEQLIAFRFVTADSSQTAISILAGAAIADGIDASADDLPEAIRLHADENETPARCRAGTLPVNIDLVMGGWDASIRELAALRVGDLVVLPDGEDAWVQGGPIRLKRVRMKFAPGKITLEPLEDGNVVR